MHLSAGHCGLENNVDYLGNDDNFTSPVHDVPSCQSFCHASEFFSWSWASNCYCKSSDSGKGQNVNVISGRTKCHGMNGHVLYNLTQIEQTINLKKEGLFAKWYAGMPLNCSRIVI